MKTFSPAWKSSRNPAKQRKYRLNAPLHLRRRALSAPLSSELAAKYGRRSITLRKGDTVRILKGGFTGVSGKVNDADLGKGVVYVDGAERTRKDGTKSFFPLQPSGLLVIEAGIEDKRRAASLARTAEKRKG